MVETSEFAEIDRLIGAYLNQDMHEFYDSVGEAVAGFVRESTDENKRRLQAEMTLFENRYHNDLEGEFKRRYGFDFTPDINRQTVPQFFDMVRAIIIDPDKYEDYDTPAPAAKE